MKLTIYDPILLGFILGAATYGWLLPAIGKYIRRKKGKVTESIPVIRCKNCYYRKRAKINEKGYLICPASGMEITDRDYCSWAEVDV